MVLTCVVTRIAATRYKVVNTLYRIGNDNTVMLHNQTTL